MTIVPRLTGAGTLDDVISCATASSHEPTESVQQAISSRREDIHNYRFSPTAPLSVQQAGEKWDDFAQRFIFSLLIRQGLRVLNSHPDWSEVEIRDLAEQLTEHYEEALHEVDPEAHLESAYDAHTGGGKTPGYLDATQAEKQAQIAAQVAMEYFDPTWSEKHRERSSKGGQAKSYSYADHLATEHLSVSAAARALGRSRGTIYAMRSEYEERDETEHSETAIIRASTRSEDESRGVAVVDDEHGASSESDSYPPRSEERLLRLEDL